ncbi:unnamed protein product [Paramecium sonneborni]|uniref:Uncharacterized protein n=1 Tax=Paramecium sonneborni TaxID=65129 RepID=A0A8S1KGR8_9CILI|nr:unnamed protein product [Paramecium sonneborni]
MKNSTIQFNKKTKNMVKSVNLSLDKLSNNHKYLKPQKSKDEYYLQISPHFQTQTLTFTNQIKKLKCIEHEDVDTEESVKSSNSLKTDKNNFPLQKLHLGQPKSQFFNDIKCSRRLKTEQ